ncbi:MAG: pyridoxal-phosphate-dependent aminotransferase family protein, partial [Planctomycetota bacterium]
MDHEILFIPGPTEVRPEILKELARPQIGHRSRACIELVLELRERLSVLFGTTRPAFFESCPATALMEAAVRNLVPKGGKVLNLCCGAFSERWHSISKAVGRDATALAVDWGKANLPSELAVALQGAEYDALTITHNETSTGLMNPLAELAEVAHRFPGLLVLVDCVSSLAGTAIDFDSNDLDLALASTQKCLALPGGFCVYALSERAMRRAEEVPERGWLLDFLRADEGLARGKTVATPSIPHLFALLEQLDRIEREGLEARFARHREMAERTRD